MRLENLLKSFAACFVAILLVALAVPSSAWAQQSLKMVILEDLTEAQVQQLVRMGLDIAAVRKGEAVEGPLGLPSHKLRVEAVVSPEDRARLTAEGFRFSDMVILQAPRARSLRTLSDDAPPIYPDFDTADTGIRDQLYQLRRDFPKLVKLKVLGRSHQGRPIIALRLSNKKKRGRKPEVFFLHNTHAREWVSPDLAFRLIRYLLNNHGTDERVTRILDTTDFWIVPVQNPDGYQYSHTNERLWRKNLRDNDGDGVITNNDGVDLNRNFAENWGRDDEGSSGQISSNTYRGPSPQSEPETKAIARFMRKHDFKFTISYHTFGNLILYPLGWQVQTPSFDNGIFLAQAGTDANPAIRDSLRDEGYDPGVSADLYITNGDFTDWAYGGAGVPGYTVELTDGFDFRFPADDAMLQTVFEDNLEFALSVIESAQDPANPVSPVGVETQDVYHTPVAESHGSSQEIIVVARRNLRLGLKYSGTTGRPPRHDDDDDDDSGYGDDDDDDDDKYGHRGRRFREQLGEIYNDVPGVHYSRYVARVEGQLAGDNVTYDILVNGRSVETHSYSVANANDNPILVLAAEDYTGANPVYSDPSGPNYLSYYTDALDAGGYRYDVWDVDAQGIPSYQDVLSHYDTLVWYTGDDFAATVPAGLGSQDLEMTQVREMLNYANGRLFATGQGISFLPFALPNSFSDDFWQYYMGAQTHLEDAGTDPDAHLPYAVMGVDGDPVFGGLSFALSGGDGANNQSAPDSFLANTAPALGVEVAARYDRPGGPLDPKTGDYYVYSQQADLSFKRLGGTYTLPAGSPHLRFQMSYDIEADWDYAFVEVSVAGSGVWTTLPDANGATAQGTGQSCPSGWVDQIHPFLANYMDADCNPAGLTGAWHAITGSSGVWREIDIDLSAYAGETVELYISYASDWGTQNLGVFVDDIALAGQATESFETGYGAWSPQPGPGGEPLNNWNRIDGAGFPEGVGLRTANSVFLGFGLEGIATAEDRAAVMDRVLRYLD